LGYLSEKYYQQWFETLKHRRPGLSLCVYAYFSGVVG